MESTQLYRHFDSEGNLLYVGVSLNTAARLYQHKSNSNWFDDIAQITVEHFDDRLEALTAEKQAILKERPKFNIMHNGGTAKPEEPQQNQADLDKENLTNRIVQYRPLYSVHSAAKELDMNESRVRKMVKEGKIGSVVIDKSVWSDGKARIKYAITGWQLIEYVEALERSM